MKSNYDRIIEEHYEKVANETGLSPLSTMADETTRQIETDSIVRVIEWAAQRRRDEGQTTPLTITDVGCGNGFTLGVLRERFPDVSLIGIEKNERLRHFALSRFQNDHRTQIREGDVREENDFEVESADIVISQRVLINLLAVEHQTIALNNLVRTVRRPTKGNCGGMMICIEAFQTPLQRLNAVRSEFELSPMPPAHHNLYLEDTFFRHPGLKDVSGKDGLPPENFLSTHYFVTRVLHPLLLGARPFVRNSEFVRFFSQALAPNVGDFSPLRMKVLARLG